jgi:hypothetical protein
MLQLLSGRCSLVHVQVRAEAAEPAGPEVVELSSQPSTSRRSLALEPVEALAAGAALGDNPEARHQPQVLRNRRAAHRQRPGEVRHPALPGGQALKRLSADGVREDAEDVVDRRGADGRHPARLG